MDEGILDPRRLSFEGDFEEQIDHILKNVRLTRTEVENLAKLYHDLHNSLKHIWPGCNVMPFGSIVTGLGITSSDVDCYIYLPDNGSLQGRDEAAVAVRRARNLLFKRSNTFIDIVAIPMAKVPIVKFFHLPTRRHCDVNFKSLSGVRNSNLLAFLLQLDPRALPLTILIKYWSKVHHLTGTNLVPNYSLIMLVIFFLQQKNILPSVFTLQKYTEEFIVENWNTAYNDVMNFQSANTDSLYQLLRSFFQFYSNFNYDENIVSPFLGYTVQKKLFKSVSTVPDDFELYKQNISRFVCQPLKVDSKICIQDPFEHSRNCSGAVFPKLALKLLQHFRHCVTLFGKHTRDEVLMYLFTTAPVENHNSPPKQKHVFTNKINKPKHTNENLNKTRNARYGLHEMYNQMRKRKRY